MSEPKTVKGDSVGKILDRALDAGAGLVRLTPTWVPRSFLHPGRRIKLFPGDLYAYGANRGGIDERWFASTTPAANENRTPDEGLSYVVVGKNRFTLADAVKELGGELIGRFTVTRLLGVGGMGAVYLAERADGQDSLGVVIGGSGNGEAMVANKVAGVRCAVCHDVTTARLARAHNDANVLVVNFDHVVP